MSEAERHQEITQLLQAHREGDAAALDRVVGALYQELRTIAHRSRVRLGGNHTLQTTAVVNEAYLKINGSRGSASDRSHFLGIAGRAMRQIIIDYARGRLAEKRGGAVQHVELADVASPSSAEADQLLLIDGALGKLAEHSPVLVQVFEAKFFLGLNDDELAAVVGTSKRTAQRNLMKARAFLAEYLSEQP